VALTPGQWISPKTQFNTVCRTIVKNLQTTIKNNLSNGLVMVTQSHGDEGHLDIFLDLSLCGCMTKSPMFLLANLPNSIEALNIRFT
jgi:hypothetical protein